METPERQGHRLAEAGAGAVVAPHPEHEELMTGLRERLANSRLQVGMVELLNSVMSWSTQSPASSPVSSPAASDDEDAVANVNEVD